MLFFNARDAKHNNANVMLDDDIASAPATDPTDSQLVNSDDANNFIDL